MALPVFCERAVKRFIKAGKNSEKVCDFVLLTTRQIGICQFFLSGKKVITTPTMPTILKIIDHPKSKSKNALLP